MQVSYG